MIWVPQFPLLGTGIGCRPATWLVAPVSAKVPHTSQVLACVGWENPTENGCEESGEESDYLHSQQSQMAAKTILPHKQQQLVWATGPFDLLLFDARWLTLAVVSKQQSCHVRPLLPTQSAAAGPSQDLSDVD